MDEYPMARKELVDALTSMFNAVWNEYEMGTVYNSLSHPDIETIAQNTREMSDQLRRSMMSAYHTIHKYA